MAWTSILTTSMKSLHNIPSTLQDSIPSYIPSSIFDNRCPFPPPSHPLTLYTPCSSDCQVPCFCTLPPSRTFQADILHHTGQGSDDHIWVADCIVCHRAAWRQEHEGKISKKFEAAETCHQQCTLQQCAFGLSYIDDYSLKTMLLCNIRNTLNCTTLLWFDITIHAPCNLLTSCCAKLSVLNEYSKKILLSTRFVH